MKNKNKINSKDLFLKKTLLFFPLLCIGMVLNCYLVYTVTKMFCVKQPNFSIATDFQIVVVATMAGSASEVAVVLGLQE